MTTVIIGAGVAGLTCATYLRKKGIDFTLLEASDAVGGRVRTDHVDGFQLDRGFQVFLTSYPEARPLLDYAALDFRELPSGARIRQGDSSFVMPNPLKDIFKAPQALFSPVGSLADKLRVLHLNLDTRSPEQPSATPVEDEKTIEFLRNYGYSEQMIDRFFIPFFRGVFLERELNTGASFFKFLYGMFAQGDVVVPARGMQAIPEQLAARLPADSIRLNTPVAGIDGRTVRLTNGESIVAEQIVIATDAPAAERLLNESAPKISFNGTVCLYFESAASNNPETPYLIVNSNRDGLIDHAVIMSDVAPEYAPAGRSLVSVSLVGNFAGQTDDELVAGVSAELPQWFGAERTWKHLRTYRIPDSLPKFAAGSGAVVSPKVADGVFLCGDYTAYPSLNGAMRSGREVAEMIAG